jgi:hypothetical protein
MPLFSVENNHSADCGTPPSINNDDRNVYIGYFQNEHGEQWVFTFDIEKRVGELRGGDASWKPLAVMGVGGGPHVDMTLNEPEKTWLEACWKAATAFRRGGA